MIEPEDRFFLVVCGLVSGVCVLTILLWGASARKREITVRAQSVECADGFFYATGHLLTAQEAKARAAARKARKESLTLTPTPLDKLRTSLKRGLTRRLLKKQSPS